MKRHFRPGIGQLGRGCSSILVIPALVTMLAAAQTVDPAGGTEWPWRPDGPGPYQANGSTCDPNQRPGSGECYSSGNGSSLSETPDSFAPYQLRNARQPAGLAPTNGERLDGRTVDRTSRGEYRVVEPPSEFQRFVAASTGQMLPIFGQWLFDRVPSTFNTADRGATPSDYKIGASDELQTTVWGQVNFSTRLVVNQSGDVIVPGVGPVAVAGLRSAEAANVLKSALLQIYKNFDLSITVAGLRSIQVFVVGDARRPGSYTVGGVSTLVNAIFSSGGPTALGSMRSVELKRGDQVISNFDLYDLLVNGDKSKDKVLQNGDVILIPAAGPRVAVAGSVSTPGIYELKPGTTLGEVLRLAGGLSPVAAGRQALVERFNASGAIEAERVLLDQNGLGLDLRNGDIVRLLPAVPRFENTVTLRGNVADAVRLPWHSGMRVSDLIPDKEVLLTRDYWAEHNKLLGDHPLIRSARGLGDAESFVEPSGQRREETQPGQPDSLMFASLQAVPSAATGGQQMARSTYLDQTRSNRDDRSFGAATSQDGIGLREFLPRNNVQPPAPNINWDYAAIERLDPETLTTTTIPFDLGGAVLRHDSKADLMLSPGDVVTIFSVADFPTPRERQPKQIRLEGEIVRAGTYTVMPGETLRQVVVRAGGVTQSAYLYGAQFTREATRREQQKRLDDFLNQVESEVNQSAATLAGRVNSAEQASTAQISLANQREMIERLRKTTVDGRIVLDLDPVSSGVEALPDMALENGDRFYVPSRPATVNVIGTVFNQASFLYASDAELGEYLNKAGGPTRFADRNRMFVVRADGSVVSRGNRAAGQERNFSALRMYPGDTLVVPSYINKTSAIRMLIDWSQVFSSLALGAAAVTVLKN